MQVSNTRERGGGQISAQHPPLPLRQPSHAAISLALDNAFADNLTGALPGPVNTPSPGQVSHTPRTPLGTPSSGQGGCGTPQGQAPRVPLEAQRLPQGLEVSEEQKPEL